MTQTLNHKPAPAPAQFADVPLERAVLGLIVNLAAASGPDALPPLESAIECMPADLMSHPDHQAIWGTIRTMIQAGEVPAPLEVSRSLPASVRQSSWDDVVEDGSATVLGDNLKRLVGLARVRGFVGACTAAVAEVGEGALPDEVMTQLMARLESGVPGTARAVSTRESGDALEYIVDLAEGRVPMISTGFKELDFRLGGGFEAGSFVILGMKTNVGKSKFAVSVALHHVRMMQRVTYLSGELQKTGGPRPVHRVKLMAVLSAARVPGRNVRRGTPDKPLVISPETRKAVRDAQQWLDDTGMFSIYDSNMDVTAVVSLIRRMSREDGRLLIVDNLDHITMVGAKPGDWAAKDEVVRRLMAAAHKYGVTVLALAQIKLDKSTVGQLSDIEDLGGYKGIASHADTMLTAWRDRKEAEEKAQDRNDPNRWITSGTFSIVKRRSGVGGSVQVGWNEEHGEWFDLQSSGVTAPAAPRDAEMEQLVGEVQDEMLRSAKVQDDRFDSLFEIVDQRGGRQ
ncbi:DnaB-like helicase C-terminal domain-containing protein [Deinococcus maricopensis]|uniref:DnaB domain protein helicase domain protein n=1 Tax=Deinococcus maricopensis (strain DSM 21211 / LMG 22137 / NRRL B-23946 / LB-34) TaxID=709986 RepID=E8U612_DEIML|nr:DnaB-like helicase C-terminal domain-containing protein [Deinococcus maricopensis]ADV66501.1 DnaB domain protein helicase domain protein [Deinococcus maricopensis DSM 21211]